MHTYCVQSVHLTRNHPACQSTLCKDLGEWSQSSPLVCRVVVLHAALHVLQFIQHSKHVNELAQCDQVGFRHEVLPSLRMAQAPHLPTESLNGISLSRGVEGVKAVISDGLTPCPATSMLSGLTIPFWWNTPQMSGFYSSVKETCFYKVISICLCSVTIIIYFLLYKLHSKTKESGWLYKQSYWEKCSNRRSTNRRFSTERWKGVLGKFFLLTTLKIKQKFF